jgi:hypothetical protein
MSKAPITDSQTYMVAAKEDGTIQCVVYEGVCRQIEEKLTETQEDYARFKAFVSRFGDYEAAFKRSKGEK